VAAAPSAPEGGDDIMAGLLAMQGALDAVASASAHAMFFATHGHAPPPELAAALRAAVVGIPAPVNAQQQQQPGARGAADAASYDPRLRQHRQS
jgi:hypothetical protein